MAPIRAFRQEVKRGDKVVALVFGWPDLKKGDVGEWVEAVGRERSVQVTRAEASPQGACVIEGCHTTEGNAAALHSRFGAELRLANGSAMENIADLARLIRPRVVDGDDKPFTVTLMVLL